MREKRKVVVIGDIFADMTTHLMSFTNQGERTFGTPLSRNGGGTGGNIASGLGRLGADVSIICRLGDDEVGRYLKEDIKNYYVDDSGISIIPGESSAIVIVGVIPGGERTIWVLGNDSAYEKLSEKEMEYLEKTDPDIIFVTGVMLSVHPAAETIRKVLPAWKGRSRIYFDPNLCVPVSSITEELRESMQEISGLSDVVLTGKIEMEALGLKPRSGQTFIVKDGERGSGLINEKEELLYRVPAMPQKAIDATGAGDTYAAAFVYAEMEGKSVEEAMRFSTAAAGISVTIPGARCMPEREQIEESLRGWDVK